MASGTLIKVENLEKLMAKLDGDRVARRTIRKTMRLAAKAAKAKMVGRARPISRKLARARVSPTAAWAPTAEAGRRPGAKQPPMGVLKGGFPAARLVAKRGLPPRPFVAPATRDSAAEVARILRDAAKEIEAAWRS